MQEVEQGKVNEIRGNKDKEHTHIELGRDNGVELVECFVTRCEHQDSLLQGQREMVGSLEVDCDQVGPVGPNEVERVSEANGPMQSLGGVEVSGSLVRTPAPDVIAPDVIVLECVSSTSEMACVSACEELVHGRIQTGDTSSEPGRPHKVVWVTAPAPPDAACEVRSVFCEWPKHARLRDRKPAPERLVRGTKPPRARLKGRLYEFETDGSTCGRVCEAPRAACRVFCSRSARGESPGRNARAGLHGKPRRFGVRVTSSVGTSRCELRASSARWLAWRIPRKRALGAISRVMTSLHVSPDRRDERASRRPPPGRCKKKKPRSKYTAR